jgi:hypothetical protein
VPHDRARILLNADECRWSKAREFYVAWSVAPDCTISARRWRLASSTETTHDLVVFSSAMGAAKADAALSAQGGVQKLIEVDGANPHPTPTPHPNPTPHPTPTPTHPYP